jgi:flagellar biosynthesis/type III secretory pathway protein FliH
MAVLNEFAPLRLASVATIVLVVCLSAHAQRDDWHMVSHDLFVKSTFAHGYMHGYEEGFHCGDLDMQMGRGYREVKAQEHFKKPVGFKPRFGDKGVFEAGYRNGYLVGYTDSYAGRSFRAVQLIRSERQRNQTSPAAGSDRNFDNAFKQGYESGQKQGLHDGRASAAQNTTPLQCDESALHSKGGGPEASANYCEAFRGGYQLGYSDGFSNQREGGSMVARK